jgi:hypothetical protein
MCAPDESNCDAQVRDAVRVSQEGRAAGRADPFAGQADQGGVFVLHRQPQVQPVRAVDVHAGLPQRFADQPAPPGVLALGLGDGRDRGRVAQQVEQQMLQDPAGPPLAEQAPFQDRIEDRRRTSDRGDAQVRAVRLGEASNVDSPLGQPLAEAEQRRG